MDNDKTRLCFKHINDNWKDEYFYSCIDKWNKIKTFIVEDGSFQCKCGTFWSDSKFILESYCCPKCDNNIQPFLSNPLNRDSVIKYIDRKYWKYIFPIYKYVETLDDIKNITKYAFENDYSADLFFGFKEINEYGVSIEIYHMYFGSDCEITPYMGIFRDKDENKFTSLYAGEYPDVYGLREVFFSNRTEYYINGKYYSNTIDDNIEKIQFKINEKLIYREICPEVYDFFISEDKFSIFRLDHLDFRYDFDIQCCDYWISYDNQCYKFADNDNICSFCDLKLCKDCGDHYHFMKCPNCLKIWHYNGNGSKCEKADEAFYRGICGICGH